MTMYVIMCRLAAISQKVFCMFAKCGATDYFRFNSPIHAQLSDFENPAKPMTAISFLIKSPKDEAFPFVPKVINLYQKVKKLLYFGG